MAAPVVAAPAVSTESKDDKLTLYITDSCPYAQRAWIAALEKEDDPAHPVKSDIKQVFLYGDKKEILAVGSSTVPAGRHRGTNLTESIPFCEYINDALPGPLLLPSDAAGRFRARLLIARHEAVNSRLFNWWSATTAEAKAAEAKKTLELLIAFQKDIAGPYLLGEQFSLADIVFIPFYEKMVLAGNTLLPELKSVLEKDELQGVRAWWTKVSERPAVKITMADRTPESMALQPFESKDRAGYMTEVFEPFAAGGFPAFNWAKSKWATGKPGQRAFTHQELLDAVAALKASPKA